MCMQIRVCFNTLAELRMHLRQREKRQTLTESLDAVSESPPRHYLCLILTLRKLDRALGAERRQLIRSETHPDSPGTLSVAWEDK